MLCESWSSVSNKSTMSNNPFLQLSGNPKWENLTPNHIRGDITEALEKRKVIFKRSVNSNLMRLLLPIR